MGFLGFYILTDKFFCFVFVVFVVVFVVEDLYSLSWISLKNLVFTIRRQLVDRKPALRCLPTHGILNLPHHIDMV